MILFNEVHRRRLTRLAAVAIVVSTTSACGFIAVHGPPRGYETLDTFDCTTSVAGPVLDFAVATFFAATFIAYATDPWSSDDPGAVLALGAPFVIVPAASGVVGLNKVSRCQEAKEAVEAAERRVP